MKKIVRKRQLFNKRIVLNIILVLFMFLTIGYSTLSTNLNILGNLNVKKYYEPTLYNILAKEAETGGLAKKYTGEHHDSFTEEPSKDIYHWYANNNTEGTQVLDKNNVIFAGQCFQMIRTTDTGGVKMIYNGEAEEGKCLSTRNNHIGYAGRSSQNLASNYWYGTDYTYDSSNETFRLSGTTEEATWNETVGPDLVGKYTCLSSSAGGTCSTLYLVESYNNSTTAYVLSLNSNSHYCQFGSLPFNAGSNSASYVGYMYNKVYPYKTKSMTTNEGMLSNSSLSTNYYYANSVTWGSPTSNKYNLNSPYKIESTDDYPSLVGKYTFGSDLESYTNNSVYYIVSVDETNMYYIQFNNSGDHSLNHFNHTYTYGDNYTDNGDGSYTINNPNVTYRSDWYTNYSNIGSDKYVCKNAVNNTCNDLWYITSTWNKGMSYIPIANNYKYANSFTWYGSKYILDNDSSISFWNTNDTSNLNNITNDHYTCFNAEGECTTLNYIYYIYEKNPTFISLNDGKDVETALNEMLSVDNSNIINSTIKSGVDAWYKHTMLPYDEYIEDTIFCNDRSVLELNGWNPNGGGLSGNLEFKDYNNTSDLSCTNSTDRFSVSNNSAKLIYKVGLMTSPEMKILNNNIIRDTRTYYWLGTPATFDRYRAQVYRVFTNGNKTYYPVNNAFGVRPAVSLKPGTRYSDGDGSKEHPYVVDTN